MGAAGVVYVYCSLKLAGNYQMTWQKQGVSRQAKASVRSKHVQDHQTVAKTGQRSGQQYMRKGDIKSACKNVVRKICQGKENEQQIYEMSRQKHS